MPTNYHVDIGKWYFEGVNSSLGLMQSFVTTIRNQFRTVLTTGGGANYKVSDIAMWSGADSTHRGFAFTVKVQHSGSPTGHEFLFMILGKVDNGVAAHQNFINNGSIGVADTGIGQFFRQLSTDTNTVDGGNTGLHFFMHYNATSNVYAMGFNNSTEGTYTGGDFTAPASSPYTAFTTFMGGASTTEVHGFSLPQEVFANPSYLTLVFTHDSAVPPAVSYPYVTLYVTPGIQPYPRYVGMIGAGVVPRNSGDVYTSFSYNHMVTISPSSPFNTFTARQMEARSTTGVRGFYSSSIDFSGFTEQNSPRSDNKYPWHEVILWSSSLQKGHLLPDAIRCIGGNSRDIGRVFSVPSGRMIKWGHRQAFPWVASVGPFPYNRSFLYGGPTGLVGDT